MVDHPSRYRVQKVAPYPDNATRFRRKGERRPHSARLFGLKRSPRPLTPVFGPRERAGLRLISKSRKPARY